MRKVLIPILVVLFVFLQYQLWGGCIKWFYLNRAIAKQNLKNTQRSKRNQFIRERVAALQQHKISTEDLAREQLGMIKKGEVYYQVIDKDHGLGIKD